MSDLVQTIVLLAGMVACSLVALLLVVIDRIKHPPKNGHYKDLEDGLGGRR